MERQILQNSSFQIQGMTCENCVKTITERLSRLADVHAVTVSLEKGQADVRASRKLPVAEVAQTLKDLPKYQVRDAGAKASAVSTEKSWFQTYKPLLMIFAFIFLVSGSFQLSLEKFRGDLLMNHIMAGFFIGLSFFKFLDLNAFAESFSSYDPIAQRWLGYGKLYPFIELALGLLFISGRSLLIANAMTVLLLAITTVGVERRLRAKSPFQCACLGTSFNLPLSNLTIAENVAMILMASYGLLNFWF